MPKLRERPGSTFSAEEGNIATVDPMPEIPEEELKNNIGEILRRAGAAERTRVGAPQILRSRRRRWFTKQYS